MESRIAQTRALLARSRAAVEKARDNVLRARALNIRAVHLAEKSRATRYENHLIRGPKP